MSGTQFLSLLTSALRFDMPLLAAELLFLPYLKRRKHFWLRVILSTLFYFALCGLFRFFSWFPHWNWFKTSFLFIFAFSLIPMFASSPTKAKNIFFYAMSAYAIQNFCDNLWQILISSLSLRHNTFFYWLVYAAAVIPSYALFWFFFVRKIRNGGMDVINTLVFASALVMTVGVVFFLSEYSTLANRATISVRIYSMVACFLLLCLQYGIFEQSHLAYQRELLKQIIARENQMNKTSKEKMDLINVKCHDLKHQIRALRAGAANESERRALDDVEKQISFFDAHIETGNEALNAVLAEKSLVCQEKKIKFSFIADGAKLNFMDPLDIYALFGNALDNAIEALEQTGEDKRLITIAIREKDGLVGIHIENYTSKHINFKDGLPETTKECKEEHGFGTKSIRYLVGKYNGSVVFKTEKNIFSLNIMLPFRYVSALPISPR